MWHYCPFWASTLYFITKENLIQGVVILFFHIWRIRWTFMHPRRYPLTQEGCIGALNAQHFSDQKMQFSILWMEKNKRNGCGNAAKKVFSYVPQNNTKLVRVELWDMPHKREKKWWLGFFFQAETLVSKWNLVANWKQPSQCSITVSSQGETKRLVSPGISGAWRGYSVLVWISPEEESQDKSQVQMVYL